MLCRTKLLPIQTHDLSRRIAGRYRPGRNDRLGRVAPVIEIPTAGHHVMLDQPIALVTALRTLLSDWDHSVPGLPVAEEA